MRCRGCCLTAPERDAVVPARRRSSSSPIMPYKFVGHRIETAVFHPWVIGYRRHSFMRAMWKYIDIDHDPSKASAAHDVARSASESRRTTLKALAARHCRTRNRFTCRPERSHAERQDVCVTRSKWQRPDSTRRRSSTSIRESSPAHIFDGLLRLRLPGAAFQDQALHRGRRCQRSRRISVIWTVRIKPGIYFQDDPAFKG